MPSKTTTTTMPLLAAPIKPKRHVYQLKLSSEALSELTKMALGTHAPVSGVRIKLDNQAKLHIGNSSYTLISVPENGQSELYKSTPHGMELIGKVTDKLNIKSELDDKAMGRMKERTEQAEKERSGRTAILLDQEPSKSRSKATTRTVWPGKSQDTPALHTKAQFKSSTAKNTTDIPPRPPKVGLRRRVLHSLALEPLHFDKIVQRLVPLSNDKLKSILNEVGTDNGNNIWTLQNSCYRDINIADWRNYTSIQRLAVMFNARDAFDALKIPGDAVERAQIAEIKGQQRKQVIPRNSHSGSSASSPASDDAPPKTIAGTILKTDSEKVSKKKNTSSAASQIKAKGGQDSDTPGSKPTPSNASLKRKPAEQKHAPAIQKRPREEVSSASRLDPSKQLSSTSTAAKRKAIEVDDRRTYKRRATGSSSSGTPSPPLSDKRRIPNSGGGSERSVSSNSSQSSDLAARNRPMKVPRITAREDYIRFRSVFVKKHSEYIGLLEKCKTALVKTNGRSSEKQAPDAGDLRKWTERYKVLHEELGLLKSELWRASREEHVV